MSACVDRYSDEQKQDQTFRFECPKDPIKSLGTFFLQTQKKLFAFLWKNETDKIKRLVLFRPLSKGGLNFRCFRTTVKALRLCWIIRLLSNSNDNWTAIPYHHFEKYGGLLFLLNCNYTTDKLDKKIPLFY